MFSKKKKKTKGRKLIVDLGTQYVKVIDLSVVGDKAILKDFRILDVIQKGRRFVSKEISKYIKKALLDMSISEKKAYTTVSGKSTLVRFLDVPKMGEEELKKSIKYQSDLHLPFDLSDAYYDCRIIPEVKSPDGKMRVVVAASPKQEVDKVIEIIKGAGLVPRKIDVDSIALVNAFLWGSKKRQEEEAIALVNIGASRTNLTIMRGEVPYLCRELNYGGISFTESIVAGMGCEFEDAEEKKIVGDGEVIAYVEEVLKPLSDGLLQSFEFFENTLNSHVAKVYLSGGGSQTRGMADFLKESLSRNVFIWNPLRSIDIESVPEKEKMLLQSNSPLLTIGLGVGLGESGRGNDTSQSA